MLPSRLSVAVAIQLFSARIFEESSDMLSTLFFVPIKTEGYSSSLLWV